MGRPVDAIEELFRFSREGASQVWRGRLPLSEMLSVRLDNGDVRSFRGLQIRDYLRDTVIPSWMEGLNDRAVLDTLLATIAARTDNWGRRPDTFAPFWVSPDICKLIEAGIASFPSEDWRPTPETMIVPSGWVWFDEPKGVRLPNIMTHSGYLFRVRGFLWEQVDRGFIYTILGYQTTDGAGPAVADDYRRLLRLHAGYWAWGHPSVPQLARLYDPDLVADKDMDYEWIDDEYRIRRDIIPSGEFLRLTRLNDLNTLAVFGSVLEFIRQRVAVTSVHHLDRAARRRLPPRPDGTEQQEVRTITLRARDYQPRDDAFEEGGREYSCRWMVRGHWSHYWVGPLSGPRRLEPRWIGPYVKGPEGAPLNRTIDLFKVSR